MDDKTKKTLAFVPGLAQEDDPELSIIRAHVSNHNQLMKNARGVKTRRLNGEKLDKTKNQYVTGALDLRPIIKDLKDKWTSKNPGKTLPTGLELDLNTDDE